MHTQMHTHTLYRRYEDFIQGKHFKDTVPENSGDIHFCPELHTTDMNLPGVKLKRDLKIL